MFALLRRAAQFGLATCAFSLAPAIAGTPASPPRAEAMKVELAWMSDSRAFALPLEVAATAEGVEIRGTVPDEATRLHVLRLARQSSAATMHDRLMVTAAAPVLKQEADPLAVAARSHVGRALGNRATGIRISSGGEGVIELHGHVASMEDRVAASRCLRGLEGCTRVENFLETGKVVLHSVNPAPTGPATSVVYVPAPPQPAAPAQNYLRLQVRPAPVSPQPQPILHEPPVSFQERLAAFWNPRTHWGAPAQGAPVLRIHARTTEPPVVAQPSIQTAWPPAHRTESEPIVLTPSAPPRVALAALASGDGPVLPSMPVEAPPPAPTALPARAFKPKAEATIVAPQSSPIQPTRAEMPTPVPSRKAKVQETPTPPAPLRRTLPAESQPHPTASLPKEVCKVVQERCGKLVTKVQGSLDENGKLSLRIHARPKAENELATVLASMPELAAPRNVHVEILFQPQ